MKYTVAMLKSLYKGKTTNKTNVKKKKKAKL